MTKSYVGVADVLDIDDSSVMTSQPSESLQMRGKRPLRSVTEPAYAVRGGVPSAIFSENTDIDDVEYISDIESRRLTVEECACLQTISELDIQASRKGDALQQIGNAVPADLATEVVGELL